MRALVLYPVAPPHIISSREHVGKYARKQVGRWAGRWVGRQEGRWVGR